jgi:hypothetical protein
MGGARESSVCAQRSIAAVLVEEDDVAGFKDLVRARSAPEVGAMLGLDRLRYEERFGGRRGLRPEEGSALRCRARRQRHLRHAKAWRFASS